MTTAMPTLAVILFYIFVAVVPALFLMRYIYRKDTVEKEPAGLLVSLVFLGVAAALVAIVLESIGEGVLSNFLAEGSPAYTIVTAFLVVAAAEEGAKYFFLYRRTWKDPNFNYRFDGIVYAVFISLGFAAFENISYVMGYGLSTAIIRAVLAIPGHMGFGVFMGLFYGRAKLCADRGDVAGRRKNLWAAYLSAVVLHGFYDACALIGSVLSTLLFLAFVVVMYIVVIRMVKRQSATDAPV